MRKILKWYLGINQVTKNRVVWLAILVAATVYAWLTGERILFLASAVMFSLPLVSVIITYYFLTAVTVSQVIPQFVIKNNLSHLTVRIHNHTIMPFGNVECVFFGDEYALKTKEREKLYVRPLRTTEHQLAFTALYRGHFLLGLKAIEITDITGLFQLKKNCNRYEQVTSMPLVKDLKAFPMSMNMHVQSQARHDLRDEDYATISDIRDYQPTDSIKRVHWKLTAKKGEWLVKIFQSNARNRISIILDSLRLGLSPAEMYALEDHMVETTIALVKHSLVTGIPIDFLVTESFKSSARAMSEFQTIYGAAGSLKFGESPPLSTLSILSHLLNDASGYINAVILCARLNHDLSERILNAANNGHNITVLFFSTKVSDGESENIYNLLSESGITIFNITDDFSLVERGA